MLSFQLALRLVARGHGLQRRDQQRGMPRALLLMALPFTNHGFGRGALGVLNWLRRYAGGRPTPSAGFDLYSILRILGAPCLWLFKGGNRYSRTIS